jgi:methyltransferase (TIGR00027 family)
MLTPNTLIAATDRAYTPAMADLGTSRAVHYHTRRTRFVDDCLRWAVARGVAQVVVVGAGFDSRAYRCRALLARTRVFEVDTPATQSYKRRRAEAVLGAPPDNVVYVPADLSVQSLDVLVHWGYDRSAPTFFLSEGLTMYLEESSVRRLLQFVGDSAPGSAIAFDYWLASRIADAESHDAETVRRFAMVREWREPVMFGLPDGGDEEFLAECRLALVRRTRVGTPAAARRSRRGHGGALALAIRRT